MFIYFTLCSALSDLPVICRRIRNSCFHLPDDCYDCYRLRYSSHPHYKPALEPILGLHLAVNSPAFAVGCLTTKVPSVIVGLFRFCLSWTWQVPFTKLLARLLVPNQLRHPLATLISLLRITRLSPILPTFIHILPVLRYSVHPASSTFWAPKRRIPSWKLLGLRRTLGELVFRPSHEPLTCLWNLGQLIIIPRTRTRLSLFHLILRARHTSRNSKRHTKLKSSPAAIRLQRMVYPSTPLRSISILCPPVRIEACRTLL